MAVLTANANLIYDGSPSAAPVEKIFKTGAITDEFYIGGIATFAPGTGLIVVTSADASEFLGIVTQRKSFTGTAGVCAAYINGIFWSLAGVATDANYGIQVAATAASDNLADLVLLAAGTTGAVGRITHVDVTGTSGWFDVSWGARCVRGTNA